MQVEPPKKFVDKEDKFLVSSLSTSTSSLIFSTRCASRTAWSRMTSWWRSNARTSAPLPPWKHLPGCSFFKIGSVISILLQKHTLIHWTTILIEGHVVGTICALIKIFRGDNNFCLTITDSGRLKLKEDHPYYYQVINNSLLSVAGKYQKKWKQPIPSSKFSCLSQQHNKCSHKQCNEPSLCFTDFVVSKQKKWKSAQK